MKNGTGALKSSYNFVEGWGVSYFSVAVITVSKAAIEKLYFDFQSLRFEFIMVMTVWQPRG